MLSAAARYQQQGGAAAGQDSSRAGHLAVRADDDLDKVPYPCSVRTLCSSAKAVRHRDETFLPLYSVGEQSPVGTFSSRRSSHDCKTATYIYKWSPLATGSPFV